MRTRVDQRSSVFHSHHHANPNASGSTATSSLCHQTGRKGGNYVIINVTIPVTNIPVSNTNKLPGSQS